jgi:transcriptional regulator with XRE-family HTH domain
MASQIRRGGRKLDILFDIQLGIRLREIRKECRLSLQDVEDMTGMRFDHISRLERGESRVSTLEIMKFSNAYATPVMFFLEDFWDLVEVSN